MPLQYNVIMLSRFSFSLNRLWNSTKKYIQWNTIFEQILVKSTIDTIISLEIILFSALRAGIEITSKHLLSRLHIGIIANLFTYLLRRDEYGVFFVSAKFIVSYVCWVMYRIYLVSNKVTSLCCIQRNLRNLEDTKNSQTITKPLP